MLDTEFLEFISNYKPLKKGMFIMSERHWNRQFMGVDSEIQIKTKSGELIVTVHNARHSE